MQKKINKYLGERLYIITISVLALFFAALLLAYRLNFDGGLSESRAVWGQFGDFLGGVLNPTLGFVTVLILISNLKLQRIALEETRDSLSESNKLTTFQLKASKNQSLENTFFRLLEDFEKDDSVLKAKKSALSIYLGCYKAKDLVIEKDDTKEATRIFREYSKGFSVGVFRYVVIEKFAALVEVASRLEHRSVHLKLLQTTASLPLVNAMIHHSHLIDKTLYGVFKGCPLLLRGIRPSWMFDDDVAKDFLTASGYEKYLENKEESFRKLDELAAKGRGGDESSE